MNELKLHVGQEVKFTGFKSASFDYPAIKAGDHGVVMSVRPTGSVGFDYWARFNGNCDFAFNEGELEPLKQ